MPTAEDRTIFDPRRAVSSLRYKPGWEFKVAGPLGRFLCVFTTTPDSQHPERERTTQHQFEIPDDVADFERWLFDQILLCELHECAEFFQVAGRRPFYPNHQDEGSPYELVDRREPP